MTVLGTAGHVDHGKTALIWALTGKDTDRLAEERRRGISIELGYAPLDLPSGRRMSVIDVPGHERFVRTMVAGATGVDVFLLCVAVDDGVMPQTVEHVRVLRALGIDQGVVALTKADLGSPELVVSELAELGLSGDEVEIVPVSVRDGTGLDALRAALDRLPERDQDDDGAPVLHVDRAFTVKGAGTVVTGTLWRGTIAPGDEVVLLPDGRRTRVRAVQEHDEARDRAHAGRRVALNLVGVEVRDVARGDVVATAAAGLAPSYLLDAALDTRLEHGSRVHVHHGTREVPARVGWLGGRFHQLRCEAPLIASRGDRLVVRSVAPPDTLGGGVVLDPRARKHGPSNDVLVRLSRLERGEPVEDERRPRERDAPAPRERDVPIAPPPLDAEARALEERYRDAGPAPPPDAELGEDERAALFALREAERVVRLGKGQHVHVDALAEVERRVREICESEGEVALTRLRDDLGIGRRHAQALLERLDADRVTLRVGDVRRLRRRPAARG
jgi:selenocysteine-specific elongation factor